MGYTYKNFVTGKTHHTNGIFQGWTPKTGPLNVPYAKFRTPKTEILIPSYCLTKETRQAITEVKLKSL